jgi:hypothetical protein
MPITRKTLFKFESIDQINGQCIVRLINPYGPIQLGTCSLDDFLIEIEVDTNDFDLEGNRIKEKRMVMNTDNPNEDLVYSYDIPVNSDGNFISAEALTEHIAKQYPHDYFETVYSRKLAEERSDLFDLLSTEHEIDLVYPDPIEIIEEVDIDVPSSTVVL